MSTKCEIRVDSVPGCPKRREKKHKKRGPESPPFIFHGVLHSFHRFTTFLTTLTPLSKLIFTKYVPAG